MSLSRPLNQLARPGEVVRQFTPNWFTATMGTGILALALDMLPGHLPWLAALAEGLWWFNMGLFALCSILYGARWVLYFDQARRIFSHGTMCMFLGAIPMGLITIVNGFLAFGIAHWGGIAVRIAADLWWLDAAMALACAWFVPFLMFTRQDHALERMTGVWLLPIVAAEVTAGSAGLIIPHLGATAEARTMLFIGYGLWATSVLPAMGILVILFLRLVLHRLPGPDMAVTSWLALGPLGTGALGLLTLGAAAGHGLAGSAGAALAQVAHGAGVIGAAILWGYGLWWWVIAMLATIHHLRGGLPFNMGWWGFTFPLGVYAVATLDLGTETGLAMYTVLGVFFVGLLALFWLLVSARTLAGAYHGRLFQAPCLMPEAGGRESAPGSTLASPA
ncbi:TDT family transporter [Salinisphaera sp. LB1]|uniref:TDT family transporter n=1 Tax=Salinisphaera sp. LB1 TaxID=2183911 RepID=UPI000D705E27|nr:TDT family transporter [Salinisphaera sp. LB1]AWN15972.1 C4-dicarboxylate transporter/malic acid transport protein [Salinisphaera sp. LB1]